MVTRNSTIDLCPLDTPSESIKYLNLTMFLVDHAATLDLLGRMYNHTASLENRYFILQDLNSLRWSIDSFSSPARSLAPLDIHRNRHRGLELSVEPLPRKISFISGVSAQIKLTSVNMSTVLHEMFETADMITSVTFHMTQWMAI